MTVRIPIIGQSTNTSFVPQQSVQAIQVADPRGEALQGLGKGIGEFADGVGKYNKAHPAVALKADQDNNAWALQSYAQCVKHGADLTAHYTGISTPGDGSAPLADSTIATAAAGAAAATPPATPADLLKTPNPLQAMITGFMSGGAGIGNPGAAGPSADNAPSPTDASVHGPTGAWINGYDLAAQSAIAAAPSKAVASSLAAQCTTDRAQGARAMIGYEAQGNVQQRQSTAISAVQTIATHGVAADPASLPEALAFIERHPIRIDGTPADQARFNAGLRQTVVGAAVQTLLARDPQGTLRQLQGGAGEAGVNGEARTSGEAGATVEADPAATLHPAIAALTPGERAQYLPQAQAAVSIAQGKAQADVAQRATAAVAPGGNPGTPPSLPEFTAAYGAERGTQLHQEMSDKLSQGQQIKIFAALPSADIERARSGAQAGLHATARANADTLGTPAPAGTGGSDEGGESSDSPFTLRAPQGDIADLHYAAQSREAANTQSAAAAVLAARQQDPVKAGIDAGAFGLKAADMRTPQAVLASAAARGPVVGVLADTYNTGRTVFTNSEFADLGKTAAAMPAQERGAFFKQLADTLGEPDLVRATFKRLGADSPVLAAAAQMQYEEQASQPGPAAGATGVISAPEHMYRGFTALNPADGSEAQAMPPETEMRAAFTPGQADEEPGTAETRYQTTKAIYASLAKEDRDKSGAFDATRWRVAQKMATDGSGTAGEVGLGSSDRAQKPSDSQAPQYMGMLYSKTPTATDIDRPELIGQSAGDVTALGNAPAPVEVKKQSAPYGTKEALESSGVLSDLAHINPVADRKSLEAKGIPVDRANINAPIGREDDNADANARIQEETANLVGWAKSMDQTPGERERLRNSFPLKTDEERAHLGKLIGYLDPGIHLSNRDAKDAAESRKFINELEGANKNVRAQLIANLSPEEARQFGERIINAREGDMSEEEGQKRLLDNAREGVRGVAQGASLVSMVRLAGGYPATPLEPEYSRLRDRIANVRSSMRSNPKGSGNTAAGDVNVEGLRTEIAASSRIHEPTEQESASGIVGLGREVFKSTEAADARSAIYNRRTDAEAKILNHVADKLGNNSQARGSITIMTERPTCESCSNIIQEFRKKYPRIRLTVIDNEGKFIFPIPRGTVPAAK